MVGLLQSIYCNSAFPSTVLSSFHSSAHVFFPSYIPSLFCLLPLSSSLTGPPPPVALFFCLHCRRFLLEEAFFDSLPTPMQHVYSICCCRRVSILPLPSKMTSSLVHDTSTDLDSCTYHSKLSYVYECLSWSPETQPLEGRGGLISLCDPNSHMEDARAKSLQSCLTL